MKLKTKNSSDTKTASPKIKNKSPKKQAKGVVKEKVKVVKPAVLKKEGEAAQKASLAQTSPNPLKALQRELWVKAIINVSAADLPAEESSIAKLLADYKKKESIPQYETKLKNFITKGFSKFKDTSSEVLSSVYSKFQTEFKALGGDIKSAKPTKVDVKKSDSKVSKPKSKKEPPSKLIEAEEDDDEAEDDDEDIDDEDDDDLEGITFDGSDDSGNDLDEESEEEKPKPPMKLKNVKGQNGNSNNKGKNGSKFKGGKVQKNKPKFNKKK